MKVLITTACWGAEYIAVLSNYSIASLLAPGNLEAATRRHEITWQVIAPAADLALLRATAPSQRLAKLCRVDEVSFESLGYDPANIPRGPEAGKYSFLSQLQNHAIASSLGHDIVIFNYSDFVWADGALMGCLDRMSDPSLDAIFTFCLPVDKTPGEHALDGFRDQAGAGRIVIAPRPAARVAIENMHRETKLRIWGGEKGTAAPSYVIWRAGSEGLVVRASHQTILALRVKPDDEDYVAGIREGSLDGYFSAVVAEKWTHVVAGDSDEIFVFSLYDTIWDSTLGPEMMPEEMLRLHLLRSPPSQNRLVNHPIFVKKEYARPEVWDSAIAESAEVMRRCQLPTSAPPGTPTMVTSGALASSSPLTQSASRLFARVKATTRRLAFRALLAFAYSRVGQFLWKALGEKARTVGRRIVIHFFLREATPKTPAGSAAPAPKDEREWRVAPVDRTDAHTTEEWISLFLEGRTDAILDCFGGQGRSFAVLPNFAVPGEAAARLRSVQFAEALIGHIADPDVVDRVLRTRDALLGKAIAAAPDWADLADWRAINRFMMGERDAALDEFARADDLRERMASAAGLDPATAVYLPRSCAFSIGLMCHLDGYVKRKILTGDRRPYRLLSAPGSVVNPAYLDYWRDHVDIVTDPDSVAAGEREEAAFAYNWNWVLPSDGTAQRRIDIIHRRIAAVQRQWQAEGRPPLLTLKAAQRDALDAQKRAWGMKDGDWFVCFHIRSAGFYKEAAGGTNDFRNTSIEDYYPAMRLVTEMGGWVIRMGDPSMPPLALDRLSERVIDYALRPEKSAVLDVALSASCRLFVASPSGLSVVAGTFGRPCALVNYPLQIGIPWFPGDLFTFKRVYSHDRQRYLTIEEVLSSTIPSAITQHLLNRAHVVLHDNEPAEIAELVREALLGDGYVVSDPVAARAVQAAFSAANECHNGGISARLGRHFAMSHASELLGRSEADALSR